MRPVYDDDEGGCQYYTERNSRVKSECEWQYSKRIMSVSNFCNQLCYVLQARALPVAYDEDGSYYYHLTTGCLCRGVLPNKFRYNILNEIENSSNTCDGITLIVNHGFAL